MKTKLLIFLFLSLIFGGLAVIFVTVSQKSPYALSPEPIVEGEGGDVKPIVIQIDKPENNPRSFSSIDTMISYALIEYLGREARISQTYRKENDQWIIICGQPQEVSGQPFDYLNSRLKRATQDNLIENNACFLGEKKTTEILLRETDIGSLDSPILSWLERYEIPLQLISD